MFPFGTTLSLRLELFPVLESATWNNDDLAVRLHFSVPMTESIFAGDNLFARWANSERELKPTTWITPYICQIEELDTNVNVGDNVVSYVGPEMFFLSITGHPLEVFTDFPLLAEPMIAAIFYSTAARSLRILFSSPMLQVPIDGSDLFLRALGWDRFLIFDNWTSPTSLHFNTTGNVPDPGPNIVSWIGEVMTIKAVTGAPLAIFTDEPVTIIP